MNRLILAGTLGLVMAGCTLDRMASTRQGGTLPSVGLQTIAPIHEAINKENPTVDPETVGIGRPGLRPKIEERTQNSGRPVVGTEVPSVAEIALERIKPVPNASAVPLASGDDPAKRNQGEASAAVTSSPASTTAPAGLDDPFKEPVPNQTAAGGISPPQSAPQLDATAQSEIDAMAVPRPPIGASTSTNPVVEAATNVSPNQGASAKPEQEGRVRIRLPQSSSGVLSGGYGPYSEAPLPPNGLAGVETTLPGSVAEGSRGVDSAAALNQGGGPAASPNPATGTQPRLGAAALPGNGATPFAQTNDSVQTPAAGLTAAPAQSAIDAPADRQLAPTSAPIIPEIPVQPVPAATPPASVKAPARDPLLGPDPDVMPSFDVKDFKPMDSKPKPKASSTLPPRGVPPSIAEMPDNRPKHAEPPSVVLPPADLEKPAVPAQPVEPPVTVLPIPISETPSAAPTVIETSPAQAVSPVLGQPAAPAVIEKAPEQPNQVPTSVSLEKAAEPFVKAVQVPQVEKTSALPEPIAAPAAVAKETSQPQPQPAPVVAPADGSKNPAPASVPPPAVVEAPAKLSQVIDAATMPSPTVSEPASAGSKEAPKQVNDAETKPAPVTSQAAPVPATATRERPVSAVLIPKILEVRPPDSAGDPFLPADPAVSAAQAVFPSEPATASEDPMIREVPQEKNTSGIPMIREVPLGEQPPQVPSVVEVKPRENQTGAPTATPGSGGNRLTPKVIELERPKEEAPQAAPPNGAPAAAQAASSTGEPAKAPAIPAVSELQSKVAPGMTPSGTPATRPETPALPEAAAVPTPMPDPLPAPSQPAPEPAASAAPPIPSRPADLGDKPDEPVELPPLSDPAASEGASKEKAAAMILEPSGIPRAGGVVVRASSDALYDPQVKQAVGEAKPAKESDSGRVAIQVVPSDPTKLRSDIPARTAFAAGNVAARVGNDVITMHEWKSAVTIRRKAMSMSGPLSADQRYQLARMVLNDLIDRTIVMQEVKRELKNPKQLKTLSDIADQNWTERELPPLLKRYAVANLYELKQKLAERDESVDEMREQYREEFLTRGYLEQKLFPRMRVDLPEMRAYYSEHLKDFDRPAETTWREVTVEFSKYQTKAEAKQKIDKVLAQLRRGDSFAAVAKANSDGPNKADGGRWQTAPGSYAVASVNAVLETLPIGQISQVIEGPSGYHVVCVEARRAAGAASFAEVQDEVGRKLREVKVKTESNAYLDKLRQRTWVKTVFDKPEVVPASAEVAAKPAASRDR